MTRWGTALSLLFVLPALLLAQPKGTKLPEGATFSKDLEYGPHERNKLDVYVPKGDGPFPLIVWVHGGAWWAGSKDGGVAPLGLLEKGYAIASINYRYSNQAIYPAQIEDCKAAIRFLRANASKYHIDADHIGVMGASAGGHLVALLGTTGDNKDLEGDGRNKNFRSKVQAVCDVFGPSDLTKMTGGPFPKEKHPVTQLMGGNLDEKKELFEKASPVKFVSKNSAPFLILHGDKDPLVPVEQSEMLNKALKECGVECELCVVKDAGHDGRVFTDETKKKMADFFDRHLKPKK